MSKKISIIIILILILFFSIQRVFSFECEDKSGQQKIDCLTEVTNNLRQQANTLASQTQYLNTQIILTSLKIQETEETIIKTQKEIGLLTSKIEGLDGSLNHLSKMLINRIVDGYKKRSVSIFSVILDSDNAFDLFNQVKYLKTAQNNNQKVIIQVQSTKNNFEEQKKIREEKEKKLNELQNTLAQQKIDINNQKIAKEKLLADTQNDEKKYQQLLADAQRELSQIQQAAKILQDAKPVDVKRGDFIGLQGNTGYSFGDHLHFGVYNYSSIDQISSSNWYHNNWVDPSEVLSSRTVRWNTGCETSSDRTIGNGNFEWPMNLSEISQGSGYTCYSNAYYRGNPHPAWDMWGPIGTSIKASEEGRAYFCRNCLGDGGNGVFIFHNNGKMTLYWHLQ